MQTTLCFTKKKYLNNGSEIEGCLDWEDSIAEYEFYDIETSNTHISTVTFPMQKSRLLLINK